METSSKVQIMLLTAIIIAILVKLAFFLLIPRRKFKIFIRSFVKWFNLSYMLEDIDENMEVFMKTSNYCNLMIWLGSGALLYLVVFFLIFPEG